MQTNLSTKTRTRLSVACQALILSLSLLCSGCGAEHRLGGVIDLQSAVDPAGPSRQNAWAADNDYDGLPDKLEVQLGTDPERIDTDNDGLTDQYELWGCQGIAIGDAGPVNASALPDPNSNGIIAALDRGDAAQEVRSRTASAALEETRIRVSAPGDEAIPNDLDSDYIPSDFELAGFYYEIDPLTGEDFFVKWDGDITRNYYKTDPTKWSSDADPWSDWEESTKRNMDQRVKTPGDHPCIPAYPDIQAALVSYTVEDASKVSSTTGKSTEDSWTNSVSTTDTYKTDWNASITAKLSYEHKFEVKAAVPPVSATSTVTVGVEVAGHYGSSEGHESTTSADTSGLTAEEWKTTIAGDTINTARLILNLNVINLGTLPVSDANVNFNLRLGDFIISNFTVELTQEKGFGELEALGQNSFLITVAGNGKGSAYVEPLDLFISLQQLRSLHLGAPLSIEMTTFEAQTIVGEFDSETGRRVNLNIGPWSPYQNALENATARVLLDMGQDPNADPPIPGEIAPRNTSQLRCFAYDNTGSYIGSPPVITLNDAFVWGFGAEETSLGPAIKVRDPITNRNRAMYLADFLFGFDPQTIQEIVDSSELRDSIFALPLHPSNPAERVYVAQAPAVVLPQQGIDETVPRVHWAQLLPYRQERVTIERPIPPPPPDDPLAVEYDPENPPMEFDRYAYQPVFEPAVRAFASHREKVAQMRFKPNPGAIGEKMVITGDPLHPEEGGFFEYRLPEGYFWSGFESVIAIAEDGTQSDPFPITVQEGSHLGVDGELIVGEWRDPFIYGTHTGDTSSTDLFNITTNFNSLGLQSGDKVYNLLRKTNAEVDAVLSNSRVGLVNWQGIGAQEFKYGEPYAIVTGSTKYFTLGYQEAEGERAVQPFEKNGQATRNIGCNFSNLDQIFNAPYSIVVEQTFNPDLNMTLKLDQAVGIALVGTGDLDTFGYDVVRKAEFGTADIFYYTDFGPALTNDIATASQFVFAALLADGHCVKFQISHSPDPEAGDVVAVEKITYVVYRGI